MSWIDKIFVYYESFERNILNKLAEAYPAHGWWIKDAINNQNTKSV